MVRKITLVSLWTFLVVAVFLINFAEDPPDAKTGAPGEGTCADCHGGDSYEGSVEISGLPSSVLVNQTYSITVTLFNADLAASQAGFQMVALNSANERAGNFTPNSADEGIDSTNGRQYIENRSVKTFASGEAFWTFDWTAPAAPHGDTITMYAAGAITNGDNKESGDDTKLTHISATLITGGSELDAFISDKADVSCNGLNDGFATVSASGGTPPYSYKWSNGDDDATTILLSAGTYTVTVSDSDTLQAEESVTIDQPLPLGFNVTSIQNVLCFGEQTGLANVTGTGGVAPYSYLWPDGFEGSSRSNLAGGSYTVTVTDLNECVDSGRVTINQPDSIVLNLTSTGETGQNTDDGSATVMVSGGTPNFSYQWSNGVTTQTIANLPPGNYNVTVTDRNGCTASGSVIVDEFFCSFTARLTTQDVTCNGANDGAVSANAENAMPPVTYSWSTGDTTGALQDLPAGAYGVTITDGNNCSIEMATEIFEPVALTNNITGSAVTCPQTATGNLAANPMGGTPPYSYGWSTGDSTAAIGSLGQGIYGITVTDATGCTVMSEMAILPGDTTPPQAMARSIMLYLDGTGNAILPADVVDDGSTDNCSIDQLMIDRANFSCSELGDNQITFTVTDNSGNSMSVMTTVMVVDSTPPAISCPDDITTSNCNAVRYDLPAATDNCSVTGLQLVAGLTSGSTFPVGETVVRYRAIDPATNFSSCEFTVTVSNDLQLNVDDVVQDDNGNGAISVSIMGGTAPYTYYWTLDGSGYGTTEDLDSLQPGTYMLTVTDSLGCSAQSDGITIGTTTSTVDLVNGEPIEIFPNPTSGNLTVRWKTGRDKIDRIRVYDLAGEVIIQDSKPADDGIYRASLTAQAPGMYIVAITLQAHTVVRRVLLQ